MNELFCCPYCAKAFFMGDYDMQEVGTHDFECDGCGQEFELYLDYDPVITVSCAKNKHNMKQSTTHPAYYVCQNGDCGKLKKKNIE